MEPRIDRWDDARDADFGDDDLGRLVYASRLFGEDTSLVLWGGGNSSAKVTELDVFGEPVEILRVKGSGWDMASIERAGFTPLRQEHVARLAELPELSDHAMARELNAASVDPSAPAPSVESILHAILPHRFVLHSHADAVLALTDTDDGGAIARAVYGDDVVVVPYVMPGFELARRCAEQFPEDAHAGTVGMVLLNHGLFTFADDAKTAYRRHIELVNRAVRFLEERTDPAPHPREATEPVSRVSSEDGASEVGATDVDLGALASLRRDISAAAQRPMVLHLVADDDARRFAARPDVGRVSQIGTATPDHVLRTKRAPMLGRDVAAFVRDYESYVERHRHRLGDRELIPVDPAPRVVLDPELGLITAGPRTRDALVAADIYLHTIAVIEQAEALGGYRPVSEAELFDVEYWELEQAKLARQGSPPELAGEIAVVTGAASGIGLACARSLLARGAAVVGVDLAETVHDVAHDPAFLAVSGDAGDPDVIDRAMRGALVEFGGIDMVIVNAGVFPDPQPLSDLDEAAWDAALRVNATAAMRLLRSAHPYLAVAPRGGRVVVIASKNVPAPGRDAAAYSASKAALTQLARVAALEWGEHGIRVNVLHPDAVFDTGLWTADLIAERAGRYGLTPDEYRTRNVLRTEVSSDDVAEAVVALCGPAFARTTGAQIPLDGGNDRVI